MRHVIISIALVLVNCSDGFGQNYRERDHSAYKIKGLSLGHNYSFEGKRSRQYHIIDIQFNRGGFKGIAGYLYGIGTEIALNTDRFTMAPKIGGFIFFRGFTIGSELIAYTDFSNWTLRYAFSMGIGSPKARLTINPHAILANKDYQPIHRGYVNFTWNFFLDKKKRE